MWQSHPFFALNLVAALVAALGAVAAWRRRPTSGAAPLAALMAGVCLWCFASAIGLLRADLAGKLFWANVSYLGVALVPASWLAFALQYTDHPAGRSPRALAPLAIEPLLVLLLLWSGDQQGLFRRELRLADAGGLAMLDVLRGPAFWLHTVYAYLLLLLGSVVLLHAFARTRELYRWQTGALLVAIAAPWVANGLYVSGASPLAYLDLTPLGFLLAGGVLLWDLRRLGLLNVLPVARDTLIEQMGDGMVVLDTQGRVVDMNAAARRALGDGARHALGRPAAEVFAAWPRLVERYQELQEDRVEEVTLDDASGTSVFELRLTRLSNRRGFPTGRLIVWHNITGRAAAEAQLRQLDERLRLHVRDTPLGYIEWDINLRVVAWNSSAERIFGYTAREVLGRRIIDLIVPARVRPYIEQLSASLRAQAGGTRSTNVNCTRDGREIICDWYNTVFVDAAGSVQGWASLVEDITERVRTEDALAEANQSLQARIAELSTLNRISHSSVTEQNLSELCDTVALELIQLLDVSEALILLRDEACDEFVIVADQDVTPNARSLQQLRIPRQALPEALLAELGTRSVQLHGQQFWSLLPLVGSQAPPERRHSLLLTPLLMHGTLQGCILMADERRANVCGPEAVRLAETVAGQLSSVIERARLLDLAERARTAAEDANQAKSRFLASMSHELHTPLNVVLGYSQLLRREPQLSPFARDALAQIEQNGAHLLALISDLLDVAKIEAGVVELQEQQLALPLLLGEVAAGARLQAERKGLIFHTTVAPDPSAGLPGAVRVDGRRLRQVLLNLLGNAVKFTDAGAVRFAIDYAAVDGAGRWRVRFEVSDTGPGIAADDLVRIRQPFQQAGAAAKRADGTGLGLAICVELLRLMGSELQQQSALGEGSRFWFELVLDAAPPAGAHEHAAPPLDGGGRALLLLGADAARRAQLHALLAPCRFALLAAADAAQLPALAGQRRPALLIVAGPPGALPDLIAAARGCDALRGVPLVCLVEGPGAAAPPRSPAAGADAALALPLRPETLLGILAHLLGAPGQPPPPAGDGPQDGALPAPPPEQLAALRDLLVVGDLRALMQRATLLAEQQPAYARFSRELLRLAGAFDLESLHTLLTPTHTEVLDRADAA